MKLFWKVFLIFEISLMFIFLITYARFQDKMIEKDKLENPLKYSNRLPTTDPYNLTPCNYTITNVSIKGLKDYPNEPKPNYPQ